MTQAGIVIAIATVHRSLNQLSSVSFISLSSPVQTYTPEPIRRAPVPSCSNQAYAESIRWPIRPSAHQENASQQGDRNRSKNQSVFLT